jgi:rhamnulokinase
MWLLEGCLKDWAKEGRNYTYAETISLAEREGKSRTIVNPDDTRLASPSRMTEAIAAICRETNQPIPASDGAFIRCIFDSLAHRYKEVLDKLSSMVSFSIDKLHVIGGGSQNALLNQLTAEAIQKPVLAGPSEATAIGNCLMQAKAAGLVADRWEIRKIAAESFPVKEFRP